ncbi:uncharacterized protein BKA55DRAFT_685035 [Fusarium redolens]|uniref:Uncharacterized protein n=1 Tax=Fusarium redolens TaxID=48865 RepID=A0A9P9KSS8_FUSRE|nr:uncharacterized protein BKA55DRAFT_685035 [Fusarium redolens]KAH7267753.1 hypothetical protein BKA55DRAFT_685035 [Fusarium redolens]
MVAATNFWNPVGWDLGALVVDARETAPQTITWDCYKPIIHEDAGTPTELMLLAALVTRPMVVRVFSCGFSRDVESAVEITTKTTSAYLPDLEIENAVVELYLLRGVMLPWGAIAYHADRMEE